jgi:SWI/SNF-related matrix-associated actin-dependent regulator of chromatin subfamily A3
VTTFNALLLRRTRELIPSPPLRHRVRELKFTPQERDQYEETKKILIPIIKSRAGEYEKFSKSRLFQANLQLRIICNHGTYQVPFSWSKRIKRDEREAAISVLGKNAEVLCSLCQQPTSILASNKIDSPFIQECAHASCSECLGDSPGVIVGSQRQNCTLCLGLGKGQHDGRQTNLPSLANALPSPRDVEMGNVSEQSPGLIDDSDYYFRQGGYSTKMEALLADVRQDLWSTKR